MKKSRKRRSRESWSGEENKKFRVEGGEKNRRRHRKRMNNKEKKRKKRSMGVG